MHVGHVKQCPEQNEDSTAPSIRHFIKPGYQHCIHIHRELSCVTQALDTTPGETSTFMNIEMSHQSAKDTGDNDEDIGHSLYATLPFNPPYAVISRGKI